jgi:hypothetical protein
MVRRRRRHRPGQPRSGSIVSITQPTQALLRARHARHGRRSDPDARRCRRGAVRGVARHRALDRSARESGTAKTAVSLAWATVGVGAAPVDTMPPVVHITSPLTGTSVLAGFAVAATATDDQGVLRVDFSVDGAVVGSSTTAPYTFTTAATLAPGSHMVAATAYDAVNHASDSVTVTIIDPTCGGTCAATEMCDSTTGT